MKKKSVLIALVLAVALLGCGKQQPRHIVILPDVSGSIDRSAEEKAFKAIDELISHLRRGDKVTIIPILGDAQAEASGRIIRFEVPTNRQAYDTDLRHFTTNVRNSLEELKSSATKHPGTKTDILGSISLAGQEFQSDSRSTKGLLVILSDFIQETNEIDFRKDRRLESRSAAKEFAGKMTQSDGLDFRGMKVYLGLLRSGEYGGLNSSRRAAIQAFWVSYFKFLGSKPRLATDGPGLLSEWNQKSLNGI